MSSQTERPPAAFCEDFNEDSGISIPETRKIANVAAKRLSKPELAGKLAGSADNTGDLDNPSRTAGTGAIRGSADSEHKQPQGPKSLKLVTTFADREPRPYGGDMRSASHQPQEERVKVPKTPSRARKEERVKHAKGSCWDCDERGYHPATPKPSSQPAKIVNGPPSPSRSRKEASAQPKQEQKPHEPAEAHSRPRRSSSTHRSSSRPTSFHAGMSVPPEMAYSYFQYPATPTWTSTPSYSTYPSYPPSSFPTGFQIPTTPLVSSTPVSTYYENPLPQRPLYPRCLSSHGQPIIQQDYVPVSVERRAPSPRKEHRESSVPRRYDREEDSRRMPPPPKPSGPQLSRRSSVKKYVTTTAAETLHQSKHSDAKSISRSSSHRRPSDAERHVQLLVRPQNKKSVSYEDSAVPTRQVERPLARRNTIYGHEGVKDFEQKHREAEEYQKSKGTNSIPLTKDTLQKVRSAVVPAKKSEAGSHRSRNSSSRGSGTKTQHESDVTMTVKGVTVGVSGDSVENKDIRIRTGSSATQIQIEGKKSRRYSLAGIKGPPSDREREKLVGADTSEKGSRKSSRSGRSGK